MLISGGWGPVGSSNNVLTDVEVWVPALGRNCSVQALPQARRYHSQDGTTVCGGYQSNVRTSCLTLTDDGTWETTTTLREER